MAALGAGLTILGEVITGVSTLLGAGSAAGTLVIARSARKQALSDVKGTAHGGLARTATPQLPASADWEPFASSQGKSEQVVLERLRDEARE